MRVLAAEGRGLGSGLNARATLVRRGLLHRSARAAFEEGEEGGMRARGYQERKVQREEGLARDSNTAKRKQVSQTTVHRIFTQHRHRAFFFFLVTDRGGRHGKEVVNLSLITSETRTSHEL